jgi:hypothetical protein
MAVCRALRGRPTIGTRPRAAAAAAGRCRHGLRRPFMISARASLFFASLFACIRPWMGASLRSACRPYPSVRPYRTVGHAHRWVRGRRDQHKRVPRRVVGHLVDSNVHRRRRGTRYYVRATQQQSRVPCRMFQAGDRRLALPQSPTHRLGKPVGDSGLRCCWCAAPMLACVGDSVRMCGWMACSGIHTQSDSRRCAVRFRGASCHGPSSDRFRIVLARTHAHK